MKAIEKLMQAEKEARDFGFQWENAEQILNQIQSEVVEIQEHLNQPATQKELQEEIGDLMHAAFTLCLFCGFDPRITLVETTEKFEKRFQTVKRLAEEKGYKTLKGKSFQELMSLWDQAKQEIRASQNHFNPK